MNVNESKFVATVGGEKVPFEVKATWRVNIQARPSGKGSVAVLADEVVRRHASLPVHLAQGTRLLKLALHDVGMEEVAFTLSGGDYSNVRAAALILAAFLVGKGCEVNKT